MCTIIACSEIKTIFADRVSQKRAKVIRFRKKSGTFLIFSDHPLEAENRSIYNVSERILFYTKIKIFAESSVPEAL